MVSATVRRVDRPAGWPALSAAAYQGPLGQYAIEAGQHTEADPVAILATGLATFGTAVGRSPHVLVGNDRHPASLFPVITGATSRGGKGTSWAAGREPFTTADPDLLETRIMGGFGSGEALVDEVRDPVDDEDTTAPTDHRLLVYEPEYARLLKVAAREGSTLSMIVRDAWDGRSLQARSRARRAVASQAHIGVVAHVTLEELRARLTEIETYGGWANRFLFLLSHRTQLLPDGGNVPDDLARRYGTTLGRRLAEGRTLGRVELGPDAKAMWREVYYELDETDPGGLLGAITAREAPQTLRIALVYALADGCQHIGLEHLDAACAIRAYARASAEVIWGDTLGDEVADRLLAGLRRAGSDGLSRTEQRDLFGRHVSAKRLEVARQYLLARHLVETLTDTETGGRPRTWEVATEATEATEPHGPDLRSHRSHSAQGQDRP